MILRRASFRRFTPVEVVRVFILVALAITGWGARGRRALLASFPAQPQGSIIVLNPDGEGDIVGEGDDFATTVLGDPWDMSQPTDVLARHTVNGATFSDGLLRYRVASDRPAVAVPLLYPGMEGAVDIGKIGANYPINTDHYRWLSFRLKQPEGSIQIRWSYAKTLAVYASSTLMSATPGWHTYVIDLATVPIGDTRGGANGWDGQVVGLDIVSFASPGTEIVLDWARLTANNRNSNNLSIVWAGLSPEGSMAEFYLDSNQVGCDGVLMHVEEGASASGSFSWRGPPGDVVSPANVQPGDYYVCVTINGDPVGYSAGKLTVNRAPILHFNRPGFASGADYATQAGNPWDMNERADLDGVSNGSYTIQDGLLAVTVPAEKVDVQVYLNLLVPIDSSRYHYLRYRLWFDYPYTIEDAGQITRVYWGRAPQTEAESDLIYVYPGWQTYHVDLRSLSLNKGPAWTTWDWTLFRMDPIANHTAERVTFYMDDIRLTTDEIADRFFDVKWGLDDPDSSRATMDLYYDADQTGMDGTHIATLPLIDGQNQAGVRSPSLGIQGDLSETLTYSHAVFLPAVFQSLIEPCYGPCFTWNTNAVEPGSYYLYACVDDGYNRLCRYADLPLLINHPWTTADSFRSP